MNIVQMNQLARKIQIAAADEEANSKLRVLSDEKSYRLAQNIFKTYCAPNTDYSEFHNFLKDLDRLLSRFGGRSPTNPRKDNKSDKGDKPSKRKAQDSDE